MQNNHVIKHVLNCLLVCVHCVQPLSSEQWNAHQRGYIIRYFASTKTNTSYQFVYIEDENANSFHLNGLDVWVEYSVQLAAFNEVGIGNYSLATTSRTRESGK